MKLSTISTILAVGQADFQTDVSMSPSAQSDWVGRMMAIRRNRRDDGLGGDIDGDKAFRPLAAMIMYMQGSDVYDEFVHNADDFEKELAKIEEKYTAYGCYCWTKTAAVGMHSVRGQTKDMTDHICQELYTCYKCVNMDYSKTYSDVDYFVEFTTDKQGNRELDCKMNNAQQDAENICECDKQFAKQIARTEIACKNGDAPHPMFGEYCLDEQYRTRNGINMDTNKKGSFKPIEQCIKKESNDGERFDKDKCCGMYPNRHPYDSTARQCCRTRQFSDNGVDFKEIFGLMRNGDCKDMGGDVVISKDGDPHEYSVVE